MAAPAEITLNNLNGDMVMSKKLSDPTEPPLALQGIGWVTRKAIGLATITLHCKTYIDDKGVTHIDIEQTGTGGVKGTTELRVLNWEESEHEDHIFGRVRGKTRYVALSGIEGDSWLKEGWLPEMVQGDAKFVESYVESVGNGWTAEQIWGFADINGERRYVRKALVKKGGKEEKTRLVYDYAGAGAGK